MPDTFAITILFIIVCTVAGAFMKGRAKDLCLRDFSGYSVTLEKTGGKIIWGRLRVENSALELIYSKPYTDEGDRHVETSYILYKSEYGQVKALVRYIDDLDPEGVKTRERELERTYRPHWSLRLMRKGRNFFGTVRDSLLEVANLFMGRIRTLTPAGGMLQGQDKYVSQLRQQATAAMQTSYEPTLERYIGKKIVLAVVQDGNKTEYAGILKDYTTEFIEVMDTWYAGVQGNEPRKADLVLPRAIGIVRHAGE
jgi:small nuclear ribonucleoprotein (snRNP)-like protein